MAQHGHQRLQRHPAVDQRCSIGVPKLVAHNRFEPCCGPPTSCCATCCAGPTSAGPTADAPPAPTRSPPTTPGCEHHEHPHRRRATTGSVPARPVPPPRLCQRPVLVAERHPVGRVTDTITKETPDGGLVVTGLLVALDGRQGCVPMTQL